MSSCFLYLDTIRSRKNQGYVKSNSSKKNDENSISNNPLTSKGAKILFDGLRDMNSNINILHAYETLINSDCMDAFGKYIQQNKHVQDVIIGSKIDDNGIETLTPYLDGNNNLKSLSFNWNRSITDKSIPYFIKMIESSTIEYFEARQTQITKAGIFILPTVKNKLRNKSSTIMLNDKLVSFF